MNILFVGGGTAGHVNPAIAIAEKIKDIRADAKILFVGREGGDENRLIKRAAFPYATIKIKGIRRSVSLDNLKRIITALQAKREAEKIIKAFSPDVIVGTGGYVCWPVISAGHRMKIPCIIHESNIYPGLTTRLCAKKCEEILLNYEETKKYLSPRAKIKTVGNPLRSGFYKTTRAEARREFHLKKEDVFIVSFGGSIGAERLNNVIIELMKRHSIHEKNVRHIHATGKRYFEKIRETELKTGFSGCKILPYIDNMATMLRAADIVISRCGAMTLSEIAEVGAASILIPSPNVTNDHQYKNAKHLADKGAAIMIEESELSAEKLEKVLKKYERDVSYRNGVSKCIELFANRNSAKLIADEIFGLINY